MTLATDLASRSQTLGQQVIANLSPWYENGVFYQQDMSNFPRDGLTYAATMATLYKYATNATLKAQYLQMIQDIVARFLATNTSTSAGVVLDGATTSGPFSGFYGQAPTRAGMGTVQSDTGTIEDTQALGWVLYSLPVGSIPAALRRTWSAVCQANCVWLDTVNKNTAYYINGNFQAQLCAAYWFTAIASSAADRPKYEDMYERALSFMVNPSASNSAYAGWGLVTDVAGSQYDWSDYQVHLSELPTGNRVPNPTPTLDWNYTVYTADVLSRLFVVNRDTRILRIINGMITKTEPRVNNVTWVFDGSGGSRTTNTQGFWFGYYAVSALMGVRSTNLTNVSSVNVLSAWDNSIIAQLTQNSTNGQYVNPSAMQLSLTVPMVREAAGLVVNATLAAV